MIHSTWSFLFVEIIVDLGITKFTPKHGYVFAISKQMLLASGMFGDS